MIIITLVGLVLTTVSERPKLLKIKKQGSSRENKKSIAVQKLEYLLFGVPFILAYLSWRWFPVLAWHIIVYGFGYVPVLQPAHWLWSLTLWFFYTWYTFFAIGLGGFLVVAAWIWKRRETRRKKKDYPMVSFIIPAYNEQKLISRCIASLFKCAAYYPGPSEIIVVDDGSTDLTYEVAWATIEMNRREWPHIYGKVVRHTTNLGKAEAIRTGVNKAMGELVGTVDADTRWKSAALSSLIDYMNADGGTAISGYIHPSDGKDEQGFYIILQQLEYSQGLGILRRAQALGKAVPVVPGPMGLYRADVLRKILNEKKLRSVTEDLEITLEMQKRELPVGYTDQARSETIAPTSFDAFWNQRLRWSMGWIHNLLNIHKDLLFNKRWLSLLLWYNLIIGYGGAAIELLAISSAPLFFWFAPDRIFFLFNALIYLLFVLVIGIINQAIALRFSYGQYNYKHLLLYTPLYSVLRFINICARLRCLVNFFRGDRGSWHKKSPHVIIKSD